MRNELLCLMLQVEPEHLRFGGGVSQTVLNPVVAVLVIIAGTFVCLLERKKAIAVFLVACILIPTDQVLLIGPFHFPVLRILILFGLARLLWAKASSRREIFSGGMNGIDKALIFLTLFTAVDGILLWRQSAQLFFQLGNVYTAFGLYFLLRHLIQDESDVWQTVRTFAYIAAAVAIIMLYEQATGRNPVYGLLGGAHAAYLGSVMQREDKFRATASFGHPILAGTFGAILLPLFIGLWWRFKKSRKIALIGILAATVIPIAANSSTSLMGFMGGLIALCFWPLRKLMRPIRWGIVLTLVSLHLAMKAPVWHLISRIDLAGGSSSYHRYELVNQCILHFWDWVLIGTKDYANWGYSMFDLSNQYVAIAEPSGLVPLIFFLAIIVLGFKYLGRARKRSEGDKKEQLFIWAVGAAMFANVVAFLGISYFDQTVVAWYALLAMISTLTLAARSAQLVPRAESGFARSEFEFPAKLAPAGNAAKNPTSTLR